MHEHTSHGDRVCDGKCYNAEGPDCDCICGGMNHGVGFLQAVENTKNYYMQEINGGTESEEDSAEGEVN